MSYGYNPTFTNPYARNYGAQPFMQPQFAPQPQMAQPQVQQPTQPVQYEMPIQYVLYATLNEAQSHIIAPNSKALFIDKANGSIYEKVCNNDGQSFIKQYKEVVDKQQETPQEETPKIDLSGYAKTEDLKDFVSIGKYNELLAKVDKLQRQIGLPKPIIGNTEK